MSPWKWKFMRGAAILQNNTGQQTAYPVVACRKMQRGAVPTCTWTFCTGFYSLSILWVDSVNSTGKKYTYITIKISTFDLTLHGEWWYLNLSAQQTQQTLLMYFFVRNKTPVVERWNLTVKVSAVDNMWMQVDNLLHELQVSGLAGLQQLIFWNDQNYSAVGRKQEICYELT